jgi:hypothetical protein
MEKLRKMYQTEAENRVEVHSSRLEQAGDRISEFKGEIEIKEKTEEILVKQHKSCEWIMQELSYSNKRPNLRIVGIEEGEKVQTKGIQNIFNKIITENFTNLKKALHIQVQESSRTPNRLDHNRSSPQHIITKTTSTENRERILKVVRQKKQTTYKSKPIQIADFLTETSKTRKAWSDVFWVLNENNFNLRILYPAILSFKIDGAIKIFHDKKKLK